MSNNDFVNRALADNGRSSPVEETIIEHWDDISAAIAAGATLGAIMRVLERDHRYVGSRSGFNSALRRVQERKRMEAPTGRTDSRFKSSF